MYDSHLADRIESVLKQKHVPFLSKKMMGGLCFMVDDKMAVGIIKNSLMIRIDPSLYAAALEKEGCRPMDFTGKILKGFLLVDPIATDNQEDLEYWIQLCLEFNPRAKSSKKTTAKKARSRTRR